MDQGLQDYQDQKKSIENFFPRFPSKPDFKGKTILEFGCGRGAFSIDLAKENPKKIVGIDTKKEYIEFAKKSLEKNFSQYSNKVSYVCDDINSWKTELKFDYIVTKEAFEHTIELKKVLNSMYNLLNPNGSIYAGFGPLYNFFNGDHGLTKAFLPWFHLILPESFLLSKLNKTREKKINSIEDLGLNKYSLKEYKDFFYNSKFHIDFFKTNCTSNKLAIPFKILSKINFLEEYCTFNIFTVLQKKKPY
tara:strand:+ start:228 stop:971 length:744 start_codon:yes stop_codon:yes gene_type:complete